jgi:uncharacterized protein YqeY
MYREDIDKKIANAMKSGNETETLVWRAIKTEFIKFRTSGANVELTDDKELQIINKMLQQRKDSFEEYKKASREDLATSEQKEMELLSSLLPKEPTEEDVDNAIKEFVSTKSETLTMKDMRDVMTFVKTKYPTVNGGLVSKLFKEKYI